MFCRKCGKEINDAAVVCPHCGVPTTTGGFGFYGQTAQQAQPIGYNNVPVPQVAPTNAETKGLNGLGIAGFVVGLVSLLFGIYLCIPSVVAFILSLFSVINRKKYKSCNGLAIAGLVISSVSLAFWFSVFAAIFLRLIIFY